MLTEIIVRHNFVFRDMKISTKFEYLECINVNSWLNLQFTISLKLLLTSYHMIDNSVRRLFIRVLGVDHVHNKPKISFHLRTCHISRDICTYTNKTYVEAWRYNTILPQIIRLIWSIKHFMNFLLLTFITDGHLTCHLMKCHTTQNP